MNLEERRLQIPATMDQVAIACDFVAEVARDAGLDDDGVYHCRLSVEEICTNIIEHGYGSNASGEVIDIVCRYSPQRFVIRVFDDAPRFNPLELSSPDPTTPLWERQSGGWGVYFVRKFMNNVEYRYEGQRNQLVMQKHIS